MEATWIQSLMVTPATFKMIAAHDKEIFEINHVVVLSVIKA